MKSLSAPESQKSPKRFAQIKFEKNMIINASSVQEKNELSFDDPKSSKILEPISHKENDTKIQIFHDKIQEKKSVLRILGDTYKNLKKIHQSEFFMLYQVILPNIFAFWFLFLLIIFQTYLSEYYECDLDSKNILIVVYVMVRGIFLDFFFNILYGYYVIFSLIHVRIKFILYLVIINSCFFFILKIYGILTNKDFLDMFASSFIIALFIVLLYYKKYKITCQEIMKKLSIICILAVFPLLINSIAFLVFVAIKRLTIQFYEGKIIFQFFLFVYFRLYWMIILKGILKYVKFSKSYQNCEQCIVIFSKAYLCNAISSCVPASVYEDLNTKEAWLGIFNFLYQVYSLYDQNYNIMNSIKKIIWKIFKKKITEKTIQDENEMKVKQILSFSLNEILIIFYMRAILFLWNSNVLSFGGPIKTTCSFLVVETTSMNVRKENIILMLFLNLCLTLKFYTVKNNPFKIVWNSENYGPLFQIYFIMLYSFILDINIQGYFYIYSLEK